MIYLQYLLLRFGWNLQWTEPVGDVWPGFPLPSWEWCSAHAQGCHGPSYWTLSPLEHTLTAHKSARSNADSIGNAIIGINVQSAVLLCQYEMRCLSVTGWNEMFISNRIKWDVYQHWSTAGIKTQSCHYANFCHHWQHHRLSNWQPMVLSVMTKMASWQLSMHWNQRVVIMPTFVITDSTIGCQIDNLWCCQWWQSWHVDNSGFSVAWISHAVDTFLAEWPIYDSENCFSHGYHGNCLWLIQC